MEWLTYEFTVEAWALMAMLAAFCIFGMALGKGKR